MLERMDQVFRGVAEDDTADSTPVRHVAQQKKWCEPTERTRTKELIDLLYRSVQPT